MKKLFILSVLTLASLFAFGQDSYTSSNGRTYKLGDTIQLGKGSGQNGMFLFFRQRMTPDTGAPQVHTIKYTNSKMVLKKIKTREYGGNLKTILVVNPNGYELYIENAIEAKEVLN